MSSSPATVRNLLAVLAFPCLVGCQAGVPHEPGRPPVIDPKDFGDCSVAEVRKADDQGLKLWAPDGERFLLNKEDQDGTAQIYLGRRGRPTVDCLTCEERPGGPQRKRFKMQPRWHPSGRWIFLAVERDEYSPPPLLGLSRSYVEGQLQNGLWTNMYALSSDGARWHRLTDFKSRTPGTADGYTGPAFTPDGRTAVWSQAMDGNIVKYYPFGRWELTIADFEERDGVPRFRNVRNLTPPGMHWNEPGNFHPDGESLVFSGSDLEDARGMDLHIINIRTGRAVNLTRSPTVWDEHGFFSPNGEKIAFMSAHPYRHDPKASKVLSIKTEAMLIDADGSNIHQLTHFRQPGYPEYSKKGGIAARSTWRPDGRMLHVSRLFFPDYEYWDVRFTGNCGN